METPEPTKITNLDIYNAMLKHFTDDEIAFKKIDEKFEKNNQIAIMNGEHMSHIRADLTTYNTKIDSLTEIVAKHIKAVEPILTNYQDTQATYRTFGRLIKPVTTSLLTLASVIGAWYVVHAFVK